MEDDIEERAVHGQSTVVLDKAQLAELVHEETHASPRSTDHLGQRFLTDRRQGRLRLALFPNVGQEQQKHFPSCCRWQLIAYHGKDQATGMENILISARAPSISIGELLTADAVITVCWS